MIRRWKLVAGALAGLLALMFIAPGDAFGQRKQPFDVIKAFQDADGPKNGKLDVVWYGNAACTNKGCHGGSPPKNWFLNPDTRQEYELIARCTEAEIFEKYDKHNDAFAALLTPHAKKMSDILGYNVAEAPQCLACHGVTIRDKNVLKKSLAVRFDPNEGISCAVCHGPHREWVAQHGVMVTAERFRKLSRQERQEKYGMRNLHDPVGRTELCVSCHVGNHAEGKFVSHEMYAAGHPPLPGFEIASFTNMMPRHWQYMKEKSPALQKELGLRPGEQEETMLVLLGGIVTFRETMVLIREQAKIANTTVNEADKMLDLANFDCWACHHDLKKQSWRQTKEWIGNRKPGRPFMRDWSTELMRLSMDYLRGKGTKVDVGALNDGIKELNDAFTVRLGGDPVAIERAATKLAKLADGLAADMNRNYPTANDVKGLLGAIGPMFGDRLLGYDSARQVGWASEIMFGELYGPKGGSMGARAELETIDKEIKLRLPFGRKTSILDCLNMNTEAIDRFNPFDFRKRLQAMGTALR